MIEGGVDLIQLRGKECSVEELAALAAELHAITSKHATPLIINDHAEIARTVDVEGVHVGQDDLAIAEARRIAGRSLLVGKSTHSLAQAKAAEAEGADYIGFGPLFATPTKPDYADRPGGNRASSPRGESTHLLHRRHQVEQSSWKSSQRVREKWLSSPACCKAKTSRQPRAAKRLLSAKRNRKSENRKSEGTYVRSHRWIHRTRHRQDAGRGTRRFAWWLCFMRHWARVSFRRSSLSAWSAKIFPRPNSISGNRATSMPKACSGPREKHFAGRANTPGT